MKTFTLEQLIAFLKLQQTNNYHGIDVMIEVMNDERIPLDDRTQVVLSVFEELELFTEPEPEVIFPAPADLDEVKSYIGFQTDEFCLDIMNGEMFFKIVLN